MQGFSIKEFGSTCAKESTILVRMQRVGAFGWWLQLNHYGKYVEWFVTQGERGKERNIVALEHEPETKKERGSMSLKQTEVIPRWPPRQPRHVGSHHGTRPAMGCLLLPRG